MIQRVLNRKRSRKCGVCSRDLLLSSFYVATPLDEFLCQTHEVAGCKYKSTRLTSDIYMLFNQKRLDRMTREALVQHFDDMAVREPSFATLKSKLTDDQLISVVKSRYIQSASELLSWSKYLNSLAEPLLKQYVEEAVKLSPTESDAQKQASSTTVAAGTAAVTE